MVTLDVVMSVCVIFVSIAGSVVATPAKKEKETDRQTAARNQEKRKQIEKDRNNQTKKTTTKKATT
jgi:hypothetical protein